MLVIYGRRNGSAIVVGFHLWNIRCESVKYLYFFLVEEELIEFCDKLES